MKKYKTGIIIGFASIFLLLSSSLVLANTENPISEFFKEKEAKLEQVSDKDILVTGENFKITKRDFVDYKENLAFINKQNGISFNLKSEEIINQMIENELLYIDAKEQKITVTEDEIKEYALQTKEAFEQNSNPELDAIHAELAEKLEVNPDDYFAHPDVLKQYEELLVVEKYVNHLFEQGNLTEDFTIADFKKDLREKSKSSIQINKHGLE